MSLASVTASLARIGRIRRIMAYVMTESTSAMMRKMIKARFGRDIGL